MLVALQPAVTLLVHVSPPGRSRDIKAMSKPAFDPRSEASAEPPGWHLLPCHAVPPGAASSLYASLAEVFAGVTSMARLYPAAFSSGVLGAGALGGLNWWLIFM